MSSTSCLIGRRPSTPCSAHPPPLPCYRMAETISHVCSCICGSTPIKAAALMTLRAGCNTLPWNQLNWHLGVQVAHQSGTFQLSTSATQPENYTALDGACRIHHYKGACTCQNCKYAHICSKCRKSSHSGTTCRSPQTNQAEHNNKKHDFEKIKDLLYKPKYQQHNPII